MSRLSSHQAPPGCKVRINFSPADAFGVYNHTQGECYHWVEVKNGRDFGKSGPRSVHFRGKVTPLPVQLNSAKKYCDISFRKLDNQQGR